MLRPSEVFPTPGGPTRQRMGPWRSPTRERTAMWSRIRSLTSSRPKWASFRIRVAWATSRLSSLFFIQGRPRIQSR